MTDVVSDVCKFLFIICDIDVFPKANLPQSVYLLCIFWNAREMDWLRYCSF